MLVSDGHHILYHLNGLRLYTGPAYKFRTNLGYIETEEGDFAMMKVLIIVGSLRRKSFNRQLADAISDIISGHAEVSFLEYSDLPMMNQDLEYPVPAVVQRIRSEVTGADGLWIVTPEYNHSYPGVLKNLIDWLSRPVDPLDRRSGSAIRERKVAISSVAGNSSGSFCRERLSELLTTIGADPMEDPQTGFTLDADAFTSDILTLRPEDLDRLKVQADAFLDFIDD